MSGAIMDVYRQALVNFVRYEGGEFGSAFDRLVESLGHLPLAEFVALHISSIGKLTEGLSADAADLIHKRGLHFLCSIINRMANLPNGWETSIFGLTSKYENILQHLDSGIALLDEQGQLIFANVKLCQIFGIPRKNLVGKPLRSILLDRKLGKPIRRTLLRICREALDYRTRFHELTFGHDKHYLVTVTYDADLDGDVLISIKDVTEFKMIEQAAFQSDKLAILGKISASIAHEIRNPLTSIRGFIQFLRADLTSLQKQEYADIILSEIDRANQIIHEFLNSSKPTAPIKTSLPVSRLIDEVMPLFQSEALMHNSKVETGPIEEDLKVEVDIRQMKQVLINIVKNALEAVEERPDKEGWVRISARRDGDWALIMVEDNGTGIDPAVIPRLFDPFFTTKQEGTGLGLPLSYRIVKNHGGKIDVQSVCGLGTTFIIRLPVN